jgi:hypothetical protein
MVSLLGFPPWREMAVFLAYHEASPKTAYCKYKGHDAHLIDFTSEDQAEHCLRDDGADMRT